MFKILRNAFKVKDLRKRILFTLFIVIIFRLGNYIPIPGVNTDSLKELTSTGLFGFYDLISGGALERFSIFALGVVPYINASIIVQLLSMSISKFEQLSKEGEEGRKKLQNITRYLAILLAFIQSYGSYLLISNAGAIQDRSIFSLIFIVVTLVTASTLLVWIGDQVSLHGIGNGVSLFIFVNIVSRFPTMFIQIDALKKAGEVGIVEIFIFGVVAIGLLIWTIYMNLAERRITVQYAGKQMASKESNNQAHIPFSITGSAVIAIIFATSVLQFPATIGAFFSRDAWINRVLVNGTYSPFKVNSFLYVIFFAFLIVFFTWFYTQVTYKPDEMAENMNKSAGFIPGIRPGEATAKFIERILDRISIIGGVFGAILALFPIFMDLFTPFKGLQFGGTMLLILIGTSADTMKQIESQLILRHYQGFLK